jgi:hypothetical protein
VCGWDSSVNEWGCDMEMWVCDAGGKVRRGRRRGECFNTCGFVASGRAADLDDHSNSASGGPCASVSEAALIEPKKKQASSGSSKIQLQKKDRR